MFGIIFAHQSVFHAKITSFKYKVHEHEHGFISSETDSSFLNRSREVIWSLESRTQFGIFSVNPPTNLIPLQLSGQVKLSLFNSNNQSNCSIS